MAGVAIRQLGDQDEEPFTALVARAIAAGDLAASSDPHGEWTSRLALRETAAGAVAEVDGRLAGFVLADGKALVVDPAYRRRGIGRALVEAGLGVERRAGRANLILGVLPGDAAGRAFLEATGFAYHSTVWDLDLPAVHPVPPAAWPDGFRARAMDGSHDVPALVELFNEAFATHPTPMSMTLESTLADWGKPWPAREEDIVLVEGPDTTLLGFCATVPVRPAEGGVGPRAEIWTIGVRPGAQGHGLGRQLLRWGVGYLRGLGVETVSLAVNGINARALGLYESEGFVRTSTRDRWARPVPPEPAA
jgi:mycothiol synthase